MAGASPGMIGGMVQGTAGVAQGIYGLTLMRQAKRLSAQYPRPTEEMNPYLLSYYNSVKTRANTYGLPGQGALENKINSQSGLGIQTLEQTQRDPASIAAGAADIDANSKGAMVNLGVEAAKYQAGAQHELGGASQMIGNEYQRVRNWNTLSPYLQAQATAAHLRAVGMQSFIGGNQTIAQSGETFAGGGSMGGGKKKTTVTTQGGQDFLPETGDQGDPSQTENFA